MYIFLLNVYQRLILFLFLQVSTLPILSSDDPAYTLLNEEAECSARQIIRHVCAGLKHYFEAHLHVKAQQIHRAKLRDSGLLNSLSFVYNVPNYKVCTFLKQFQH